MRNNNLALGYIPVSMLRSRYSLVMIEFLLLALSSKDASKKSKFEGNSSSSKFCVCKKKRKVALVSPANINFFFAIKNTPLHKLSSSHWLPYNNNSNSDMIGLLHLYFFFLNLLSSLLRCRTSRDVVVE